MDLRNSKEATGWNGENMRSMGGVLRDHIRKITGGWNAWCLKATVRVLTFGHTMRRDGKLLESFQQRSEMT